MREVGLIETVWVRAGKAPLWPLHLARLQRSAQLLGIPVPTVTAPAGGEDRVVRLLLERRGVTATDRPPGPTRPITLVIADEAHAAYPLKTTERELFDRVTDAARAVGADDGVLLADGVVAEAARWTLLWWEGDHLAGPPLALGILDSVARERIRQLTGEIESRPASPAQLRGVPLFAANAARGIVHVARFDGHEVPESPRTSELAARFWP